jgi:hypothetical protein
MGQTPRWQIPYPDANVANDVPAHMGALAGWLDGLMTTELNGTLASRPAAGKLGRYYVVSGDSAMNNGRWFRDNGTAWVELPAMGTMATWAPTVQAASGIVPTLTPNAGSYAQYVLLGSLCHAEYKQLTTFTGTASYDYRISLPIAPAVEVHGSGICQNDGAFVYAIPGWTGLSMRHARIMGGTGDLVVPGGPFFDHFTITYRYR